MAGTYFGTLDAAQGGPSDDADGDGANNLQEYRAGTNPVDASSVFRLMIQCQETMVHLSFTTIAGRQYRLESAENLSVPSWLPIGEPILGGGSIMQMDVPRMEGAQKRFYRVQIMR